MDSVAADESRDSESEDHDTSEEEDEEEEDVKESDVEDGHAPEGPDEADGHLEAPLSQTASTSNRDEQDQNTWRPGSPQLDDHEEPEMSPLSRSRRLSRSPPASRHSSISSHSTSPLADATASLSLEDSAHRKQQ